MTNNYETAALVSAASIKKLMTLAKENESLTLEDISIFEEPRVIAYRPQVANYLGSIEAAIYYQQLNYWQKYAKRPDGLFYKSAKEIEEETFISEKVQRRCREVLVNHGWIEVVKKMANGHPTYHFRVIIRSFTIMSPTGQTPVPIGQTASSITLDYTQDKKINKKEPPKTKDLLISLIALVNPKEKPTDERIRLLNGRLKDYTEAEITAAAKAFAKSTWHIENKQMTIDNLLVPSKFGRWYTASQTAVPGAIDDDNMTMKERAALLKERMG